MTANPKLIESIAADAQLFTALRRDIHAHPEVCFQEQRTSDLIARTLLSWGISVHRNIGNTGVVGVLKRGSSDRAIGLRADMDALPMTEHNTFVHASVIPGMMHACGHDGHMAMLLAAARGLALSGDFDGTVYFIFQPAEEGGGGAREMIKDGLFERFPMEAIFGMHNRPGIAVGRFAVKGGLTMASSNEFRVTIRGKGTHAAMPHGGVDPVPIACQMVQAFQTIVTRNLRAIDAAVISVTSISAGEAINVIPDACEVRGTVRTLAADVLDLVETRMREVAEGICATFGASCEFAFVRLYPPTVNHERESEFVRAVLCEFAGAGNVSEFEPSMGSEDFSFYLREKPGCFFFIGNGAGEHRIVGHGAGPCTLHGPSYDFNDALIPLGGSLWVQLVRARFAK